MQPPRGDVVSSGSARKEAVRLGRRGIPEHPVGVRSKDTLQRDLPPSMFDSDVGSTHAWSVGIRSRNCKHHVVVLRQIFRYLSAPMYEVVAGKASASPIEQALG
jgi:hypothetical protein